MSARASMAPGTRRGPSAFSSSLSSSQSASTSSQPVFSFRPHVLLSHVNGSNKENLLDYTDLTDRIEMFKEVFLAQSEQTMQALQRASEEHNGKLREEKRNMEMTKEAIEKQKDEQRKTYQGKTTFTSPVRAALTYRNGLSQLLLRKDKPTLKLTMCSLNYGRLRKRYCRD